MLERGQKVLHKSCLFVGPTMVVIRRTSSKVEQYVCRWWNPVSGGYQDRHFFRFELSALKEEV